MNSTRLPGKAVMDLNGLPVLWHLYRRLLACKEPDEVIVAIGRDNPNPILEQCDRYTMRCRIGSEEDLLSRHRCVGREARADAIVRVTADCVFHDPALIDSLVSQFRSSWPRCRGMANWPYRLVSDGLDCDIWSMELLAELERTPECPREDFAAWVCNDDERAIHYCVPPGMQNPKSVGEPHLSIDTPEDFIRAEKMLKILGNNEWRYEETLKAYVEVTR